MSDRATIVATLLRVARELAVARAFARDGKVYADIACSLTDHETAASLHAMIVAHEARIVALRRLMADLAEVLARMPIEVR